MPIRQEAFKAHSSLCGSREMHSFLSRANDFAPTNVALNDDLQPAQHLCLEIGR
jgi:hypothetical protein